MTLENQKELFQFLQHLYDLGGIDALSIKESLRSVSSLNDLHDAAKPSEGSLQVSATILKGKPVANFDDSIQASSPTSNDESDLFANSLSDPISELSNTIRNSLTSNGTAFGEWPDNDKFYKSSIDLSEEVRDSQTTNCTRNSLVPDFYGLLEFVKRFTKFVTFDEPLQYFSNPQMDHKPIHIPGINEFEALNVIKTIEQNENEGKSIEIQERNTLSKTPPVRIGSVMSVEKMYENLASHFPAAKKGKRRASLMRYAQYFHDRQNDLDFYELNNLHFSNHQESVQVLKIVNEKKDNSDKIDVN